MPIDNRNLHDVVPFEFLLATGTTGSCLKKYLQHSTYKPWIGITYIPNSHLLSTNIEAKIIRFESGPKGGDIQIEYVALEGIFLQL